jgi:hypothetical protein
MDGVWVKVDGHAVFKASCAVTSQDGFYYSGFGGKSRRIYPICTGRVEDAVRRIESHLIMREVVDELDKPSAALASIIALPQLFTRLCHGVHLWQGSGQTNKFAVALPAIMAAARQHPDNRYAYLLILSLLADSDRTRTLFVDIWNSERPLSQFAVDDVHKFEAAKRTVVDEIAVIQETELANL